MELIIMDVQARRGIVIKALDGRRHAPIKSNLQIKLYDCSPYSTSHFFVEDRDSCISAWVAVVSCHHCLFDQSANGKPGLAALHSVDIPSQNQQDGQAHRNDFWALRVEVFNPSFGV
jgi:hypothetical protein